MNDQLRKSPGFAWITSMINNFCHNFKHIISNFPPKKPTLTGLTSGAALSAGTQLAMQDVTYLTRKFIEAQFVNFYHGRQSYLQPWDWHCIG
jgi:hypothetical protein